MIIDFISVIFILALVFVVVALIFDRFKYAEQAQTREDRLLEENSRLVKAIIAKNAQDYVMTTSIDKVPSDDKPKPSSDIIPEESLSDDEFFDAIGKKLKEE